MRSITPTPVHLMRVRRVDSIGYTAISEDSYRGLLRALLNISSNIQFKIPKEVTLSEDIEAFSKTLYGVLCRRRQTQYVSLIIEFLNQDVDADLYDDFCNAITLALSKEKATSPACIVLAVSNTAVFKESVLLQRKLLPLCRKKIISLVLVCEDTKVEPEILTTGRQITGVEKLPGLQLIKIGSEHRPRLISTKEVRALVQVLNGHFGISLEGTEWHFTGVINVMPLLESQRFIDQVREDIATELGSTEFAILPIGIPSGGIRDLAITILDGNTTSLLAEGNISEVQNRNVVILCDMLGPHQRINDLISLLRKSGYSDLVVCSIGWTWASRLPEDMKVIKYVELPISIYPFTSTYLIKSA